MLVNAEENTCCARKALQDIARVVTEVWYVDGPHTEAHCVWKCIISRSHFNSNDINLNKLHTYTSSNKYVREIIT